MNARLYIWQRLSAAVMVPLIAGHFITIIYAVGNGLDAGEILARTQGSVMWALFYGTFVGAAAVHAGIGVWTVLGEWLGLAGRTRDLAALVFGLMLAGLGARAVIAVVL